MGMFDEIRCGRVMPDGYQGAMYQTKDLSCNLDTYEITEDGRLVQVEQCGWNGMEPLTAPEDTNFHGWLNFYDLDKNKQWHEYNAKFTDGRLVEIVPANEKGNQTARQGRSG